MTEDAPLFVYFRVILCFVVLDCGPFVMARLECSSSRNLSTVSTYSRIGIAE